MMLNKNLNYLNNINSNINNSFTPRLINNNNNNNNSNNNNNNNNSSSSNNINTGINSNLNGCNTKLQLEKRFFEEKSLIKPWLQTQLNPLGINIVIERSDDSKIVFKCKNLHKNLNKVNKVNKLDKINKSKHVCPFRIRANYSLRAKQWTIVIVNDQHNHPISINNENETTNSDNSLAYLNKLPLPIPNSSSNLNLNMNENFNNSTTSTINKNISLNLLHLEINNLLLNLNSNLSISNNLKEITYNKIINILKSLQSVQNFDFSEKKIFNSPPNGNENNSIMNSNYSYNTNSNSNNGTDLQNFDKIILPSLNNFHTKFSNTNSATNSNSNLNSNLNSNGNGLFSQFYM